MTAFTKFDEATQAVLMEWLYLSRRGEAPIPEFTGRSLPAAALIEAAQQKRFTVTERDLHRLADEIAARMDTAARKDGRRREGR